ncbi:MULTISPECIES: lipase family protein [Photorhabdus]|uniref:Lipase (Class 3) n=2 Tax=Photorhabdus asymbiotica TaxID=291112 RepID=A0ABX9SL18_9GAMM|nr:lipase family protein [Photorhabdus asymbiotica]RKS56622.1 lipase (class 3) [Photorhabdus asymbiotica]CAQ85005.1 similar to lipase/esterase [Photorhabdus asymbiotica]
MTISLQDQRINLALSFISGSGSIITEQSEPTLVAENIKESLEKSIITANRFSIVWGPAVFRIDNGKNTKDNKDDHVLFIVKNRRFPYDYRIVIRGSWSDVNWQIENFAVHETVNWSLWDSNIPADFKDAKISYGTHLALDYIVNQAKSNNTPGYGESLIDAIDKISQEKGIHNITITGHSLGGVLASTLGLYLKRLYLNKGKNNIRINVCAFASPITGNNVFSSYVKYIFNSISIKSYKSHFLRIYNRKDIISLIWHLDGLAQIPTIYEPLIKIDEELMNKFQKIVLIVKDKDYTKLTPDLPFTAPLLESSPDLNNQVVFQHIKAYANQYGMNLVEVNDGTKPPIDDIVVINGNLSQDIIAYLSRIPLPGDNTNIA